MIAVFHILKLTSNFNVFNKRRHLSKVIGSGLGSGYNSKFTNS